MVRRRLLILNLLYAVFLLSGVAGLGYQMVWTRMFAIGLGHEMPSVLAVVAAFFGGLALGAWALDGVVSRSAHPGRWYAVLELVIGAWGFIAAPLIPLANELALQLIGAESGPLRHWTFAFLVPFITLLPATTAMGATLPAMERYVSPLAQSGRALGGLYAANTAGAVAGTLLGAFVLTPLLGYRVTILALAATNVLIGIGMLVLAPTDITPLPETRYRPPAGNLAAVRLRLTVFVTGLLGIGYEVLAVRVMSQVLENTVYSYASALAIYLLGTAAGAALYQRLGGRFAYRRLLGTLLCALAFTCLAGTAVLYVLGPLYDAMRHRLPDSLLGVFAAEMAAASLVFLLPTLVMGATFSHLVQAARREEGGIGSAMAINTLGGAVAPPVLGVVLLPLIGARVALTIVSLAYLALIPRGARINVLVLAAPLILAIVLPMDLQIVELRPGDNLVVYREGVMASVAVVESEDGARNLRINNRFQMGGTDAGSVIAERRQAQIPLLLHPRPRKVLFLGVATGITLGASASHADLEAHGIELVPEVLEVLPAFAPFNSSPTRQERMRLVAADARRFVRATDETYDVIVADLFHPGRDGAGTLYTREHFRAVRERLRDGGLFCQWLPLYQMDEDVLKLIVRTFLEVFPEADAFLAHDEIRYPALGLVGWTRRPTLGPDWYERRAHAERLQAELGLLFLPEVVQLLGSYITDAEHLERYAGAGPVNTDDHPRVMFEAPRFTYRLDATGHGRFMALLASAQRPPDAITSDEADDAFRGRVRSFIRARDIFIDGQIVSDGDAGRALPYNLDATAASADFELAYRRVLGFARELAESRQLDAARQVLGRLIEARPERNEAREQLAEINRSSS